MKIHLVDGTWELFRAHFGAPPATAPDGREVGAVRGLLRTLHMLVSQEGATHVAVAFDTVIESFRNRLFDGYKTGEGVEPELLGQFALAEEACRALGITCWSMVEFEADDALATAATAFADRPEVDEVLICTPDKDLAQCVRGSRVVQLDRKSGALRDEAGVAAKFGVAPGSIPDWLALVGDTADGIPGLPRWGEKSAAAVLSRHLRIEEIPADPKAWEVPVRGAAALSAVLEERREDALLYRTLATLRTDVPLELEPEGLAWQGAHREALLSLCERIGEKNLPGRIKRWA